MEKVEPGLSGELISCMELGTMYFGTKIDVKTSFQLLDYYVQLGGGLLDSANKYACWVPGYQGGESESLIGKRIKQKMNRHNLFITSKVGFSYSTTPCSLKKEIIISECEKSLKRLCVETIDLNFTHAYDDETPLQDIMEAFYNLKRPVKSVLQEQAIITRGNFTKLIPLQKNKVGKVLAVSSNDIPILSHC
jgi:aryl-alcohol dehydrogenase-like predicted oxidoreductase